MISRPTFLTFLKRLSLLCAAQSRFSLVGHSLFRRLPRPQAAGLCAPANREKSGGRRIENLIFSRVAPVAQLDRALASGAKGFGFDSRRAHHQHSLPSHNCRRFMLRPKKKISQERTQRRRAGHLVLSRCTSLLRAATRRISALASLAVGLVIAAIVIWCT